MQQFRPARSLRGRGRLLIRVDCAKDCSRTLLQTVDIMRFSLVLAGDRAHSRQPLAQLRPKPLGGGTRRSRWHAILVHHRLQRIRTRSTLHQPSGYAYVRYADVLPPQVSFALSTGFATANPAIHSLPGLAHVAVLFPGEISEVMERVTNCYGSVSLALPFGHSLVTGVLSFVPIRLISKED